MNIENLFFSLKQRMAPYKNNIYVGILCLIFITTFVIKMGNKKQKNEADFVLATNAFIKWEQALDKEHDELKSLASLMKKHPELQTEYESKLAQNFIAIQEIKKAKKFGTKVVQRTNQPYYRDYAYASLLISEEKISEALEQALYLKKKLLEDNVFWKKSRNIKTFGSGLFAFNLMRIATLYQKLGMKELELEAWHELKSYAGWSLPQKDTRISKEGFQSLLTHFSVEQITLLDYISARETTLSH